MVEHIIKPTPNNLQGYFSRDASPILTIQSGDTIVASVPDADGREIISPNPLDGSAEIAGYDRERNTGHCLIAPIAIEGAKAGMTLEVHIRELVTGNWGWTSAGWNEEWNEKLNIQDPWQLSFWSLDNEQGIATHESGFSVEMSPFLGVIGTAPNEAGELPTPPPRTVGGNIDCKELIVGTRLFLPIEVDGALLMFGDGHARQGDGEVSGTAIECGMQKVVLDVHLHESLHLTMPRANTPKGWLTFGFDRDLDVAYFQALSDMLDLMQSDYGLSRLNAYSLASAVVDLHITQVVNAGVKGVHAILPHDALKVFDA